MGNRCVIMLCEEDPFGLGQMLYRMESGFRNHDTGDFVNVKRRHSIVYVNLASLDLNTELGRALSDFLVSRSEDALYNGAREKLMKYKDTDAGKAMLERRMKEREEYMAYAREEGLNEGISKGRNEEKMTIASSLLKDGLDYAVVSRNCGMSLEEVGHLASSLGLN